MKLAVSGSHYCMRNQSHGSFHDVVCFLFKLFHTLFDKAFSKFFRIALSPAKQSRGR